jgi:hypothetical protein
MPKLERLSSSWSVYDLTLVRENRREILRVNARGASYGGVIDGVDALAGRIERIEILGNAALAKRMKETYGRHFEIIARPYPSGFITGVRG